MKVTACISFGRSTDFRASREQFLFTEKFIIKLLLGLKVTAWICLQMSTGIRGKLGTVLGRHYHLDLPSSLMVKTHYIHFGRGLKWETYIENES